MSQVSAQPLHLPAHGTVESKLHKAWRKERRYVHLRGLCHLLVWTIALIAVDFVVDKYFDLPAFGRRLLVALNLAVLLWVGWHYWFRHLRRYDAVRVALQVEGRHGELQSLLVSYVQLQSGANGNNLASPRLVDAMRRQAITVTDPINFKEIISYNELRGIFLVSIAVLIASFAMSLNWSAYVRTLLFRLLNPSSDIKYPTRTHIRPLIEKEIVIKQGDTASLRFVADGLVPNEGTILIRPDGGEWQKILVNRSAGNSYGYDIDKAYQSFNYYAKIGDTQEDNGGNLYRVTVVAPPHIANATLYLHYPPHTKLPDRAINTLNAEVPEGTQVRLSLQCDQPVQSARIIFGDTARSATSQPAPTTRPMETISGGAESRTQFTARKSMVYRFQWTESAHGKVFDYTDDVRHVIQVVPDAPPQVDIIKPVGDDKATVRLQLPFSYRASDDYGITGGWIVYNVNDQPEQRFRLPGFKAGTWTYTWPLKSAIPDIKEGDAVTYSLEVEDNYPGPDTFPWPFQNLLGQRHPHRVRSQNRVLSIVSIPEYEQYIAERRAKVSDEIKQVYDSELKSDDEVRTLKGDAPGTGFHPATTRPAAKKEGAAP